MTVITNDFIYLPLFVIILLSISETPIFLQQAVAASPYDAGYSHGCNDAKISNPSDRYISQPGKGPSSHTFLFMLGVSGVELKGTHTQEFLSGYLNGTKGYLANRGWTEGYNHLPMSFPQNPRYTFNYKLGAADRVRYDKDGVTLVAPPAHTNDNYRDFHLGMYQGANAAVHDYDNSDMHYDSCPLGHTAEYCAGWKSGYNHDADELGGLAGTAILPPLTPAEKAIMNQSS